MLIDNTERVAKRIAELEQRYEVAKRYDDGTISGFLQAKALIEQIDRAIAALKAGDVMNCINCSDLVDGKVAGDTYWCQHCNLPLCRRMSCIFRHVTACEIERRAIAGHDVVNKENERTHYQPEELRQIVDRAHQLKNLKA